MGLVYVLRNGRDNLFKIGRTRNGSIESTLRQLSRGNPSCLMLFDQIVTDEYVFVETYLHRALRSKKRSEGGGQEWFEARPQEIEEAVQDARSYLEECLTVQREAECLRQAESRPKVVAPNSEHLRIYKDLIAIREKQDFLGFQRKFQEAKLQLAIGDAEELSGIARWKSQRQMRFDSSLLKRTDPELYQRYPPRIDGATLQANLT